jgi:hypothetical protein
MNIYKTMSSTICTKAKNRDSQQDWKSKNPIIKEIAEGTTNDNIPKCIFEFRTKKNTTYLIDIKVSAKNVGSTGGAIFFQSVRGSNDSHSLTISAPVASGSNGTLDGATIYLSVVGPNLFLNVVGLTNQTINWLASIELIAAK